MELYKQKGEKAGKILTYGWLYESGKHALSSTIGSGWWMPGTIGQSLALVAIKPQSGHSVFGGSTVSKTHSGWNSAGASWGILSYLPFQDICNLAVLLLLLFILLSLLQASLLIIPYPSVVADVQPSTTPMTPVVPLRMASLVSFHFLWWWLLWWWFLFIFIVLFFLVLFSRLFITFTLTCCLEPLLSKAQKKLVECNFKSLVNPLFWPSQVPLDYLLLVKLF